MTSQANTKCTCGHTLHEHQRETLVCQYRPYPCRLFQDGLPGLTITQLKPGTAYYTQARNKLVIALEAMRARAAKAQHHAIELGMTQLASDCGLYVEDITAQIHNVHEIQRRPNVAYAEL